MCSIKLASIHHLDHLEEQKRVEREPFMANRVATQGCTEHRRAQTAQTVSQSGHDPDVCAWNSKKWTVHQIAEQCECLITKPKLCAFILLKLSFISIIILS